jgi:hypothetical protein
VANTLNSFCLSFIEIFHFPFATAISNDNIAIARAGQQLNFRLA